MVKRSDVLERVLVLEMVRVTECAAMAASHLVGRGDEKAADAAAVDAMRDALNELAFDGGKATDEDRTGERCAGRGHAHVLAEDGAGEPFGLQCLAQMLADEADLPAGDFIRPDREAGVLDAVSLGHRGGHLAGETI